MSIRSFCIHPLPPAPKVETLRLRAVPYRESKRGRLQFSSIFFMHDTTLANKIK